MKSPLRSLAVIALLTVISTLTLAAEGKKAILITGASSGIGRNMAVLASTSSAVLPMTPFVRVII